MRRAMVAVAGVMLAGASAPPAERVVSGDGMMTLSVNGEPVRVRVDPAAPGMPLFTRTAAERLHLKMTGNWGVSFVYGVGNTRVPSRTSVVRVDAGSGAARQRVGWAERPFAARTEGSVGPAGLPEPVIRFALRARQAGERTAVLPMASVGFPSSLFGGGVSSTFAIIQVGGEPMRVRLDPYHPRSLATAGAAVRIARAYDGALSGDPVPTEIFFGVERPVRTLTLARPLAIGGVSLATLGVRTQDAGNAASIREAGAMVPAADPDEVVVTGTRKRDVRRDVLSLGADALGRCSSIVFDKAAKQVRLSCL